MKKLGDKRLLDFFEIYFGASAMSLHKIKLILKVRIVKIRLYSLYNNKRRRVVLCLVIAL
jgi:hypothetical protein